MDETPKKILIVEDEIPMAKVLELKLKKAGYLTRVANDGVEALKALGEETFDLMLIDMIMPMKDGFTVLQEMSPGRVHTIFAMSNLGMPEDIAKVKKLGAKEYFVKSDTDVKTIVSTINATFTT